MIRVLCTDRPDTERVDLNLGGATRQVSRLQRVGIDRRVTKEHAADVATCNIAVRPVRVVEHVGERDIQGIKHRRIVRILVYDRRINVAAAVIRPVEQVVLVGAGVRIHHETDIRHANRVITHVRDLVVDSDEIVRLLTCPLVALLDHSETQALVKVDRRACVDVLFVGVRVDHPEHLLRDSGEILIDETVGIIVDAVERVFIVPLKRIILVEDMLRTVAVIVCKPRAVRAALPGLVDDRQEVVRIRAELPLKDGRGNKRIGTPGQVVLNDTPEPQTRCKEVLVVTARRPLAGWVVQIIAESAEVPQVTDVKQHLPDVVIPAVEDLDSAIDRVLVADPIARVHPRLRFARNTDDRHRDERDEHERCYQPSRPGGNDASSSLTNRAKNHQQPPY